MSTTIAEALRAVVLELEQGGIEGAARDARLLMAHAIEVTPAQLNAVMNDAITPAGMKALDAAIEARLERKPVSHITGRREFWGRDFRVGPMVLDPRPETETLIEAALAKPFEQVLDLGTGSGCILLTLLAEREGARGTGVDISPEALDIAVANRADLGLTRRAVFTQSDWFERVVGRFDLVVSNPPYIPLPDMGALAPEVLKWEPMAALTPGLSGLESYHAIAAGIGEHIAPGGRLLLEIGPGQAEPVAAIMAEAGLDLLATHDDMDARPRVLDLRAPA